MVNREDIVELLEYRHGLYKEFEENLSEGGKFEGQSEKRKAMIEQTRHELKFLLKRIEEGLTKCSICGDSFDSPKGLNSHMQVHSKSERRQTSKLKVDSK